MGQLILLTGARGFIGARLARRLAAAGHDIVMTGRQSGPSAAEAMPGSRYVQADLSEPGGVEALLRATEGDGKARRRWDAIIHLAAKAVFQDDFAKRQEMYRSNVTATLLLLEMAREHADRFLFVSSGMVYGDQPGPFRENMETRPGNFYALTKLMGEEMTRAYSLRHGFAHLILRTSIVYGPGQAADMFIPAIIKALSEGREFPMTEGKQIRDFLYIDDCLHALETALAGNLAGTYNLASGTRTTLAEVADLAGEAAGAREKIKVGALAYRPNELWEYYMDTGKLRADSGWAPEVNLKAGLERMMQHAAQARH
jgi:nucleoside-diphosphate-sugar epimerase